MDKLEFIEKAPAYYAVAIARSLEYLGGLASRAEIETNAVVNFSTRGPLWGAGLAILQDADLIETIRDDFGPTLYRANDKTGNWLNEIAPKTYPWVKVYREKGDHWLNEALSNIFNQYETLRLTDADFEAAEESEWEPIPINRDDPKLLAASAAVDEVIEKIEGDNGYAVHAPDERQYALSSLKVFRTTLKEQGVIYARQIKAYAIDPLVRVTARFGNAALGLAASAARQAIFEWIKEHAAHLLSLLWS